jgi:hypothetical protein
VRSTADVPLKLHSCNSSYVPSVMLPFAPSIQLLAALHLHMPFKTAVAYIATPVCLLDLRCCCCWMCPHRFISNLDFNVTDDDIKVRRQSLLSCAW